MIFILDIKIQNVFGFGSVLGQCLHHDFVQLPVFDKVAGVFTSQKRLQSTHSSADRNSFLSGFIRINIDNVLRITGIKNRKSGCDFGSGFEVFNELIYNTFHLLKIATTRFVQKTQLKSTGVAVTRHGGRGKKLQSGIFDVLGFFSNQCNDIIHRFFALVPAFEVNQTRTISSSRTVRKNVSSCQ